MDIINGGVCAPLGFTAAGIHCGIRQGKEKKDLALIVSRNLAAVACVYTQNLVRGAPIEVTKKNVKNGWARAIIANSGNANTCNINAEEAAKKMCALAGDYMEIGADNVVVASTGVIGQKLDTAPIESAMARLISNLGDNSADAAEAIMTTDLLKKETAVEFSLDGIPCRIGGIAKGSGMIHPNMATMLSFITSDVCITPDMLQRALSADVQRSFNMISVDGDTSTNDMVSILANGAAANPRIETPGEAFDTFCEALNLVTGYLCKMIARDGEGATKLIECTVTGAVSLEAARSVAKAVIRSPLVKAAMFGADANWGRVLCAIGNAGVPVCPDSVSIRFNSAGGTVLVCENGIGVDFSEDAAKKVLLKDEVVIEVLLGDGNVDARAWGCDLTYDYVKINGDYRT